MKKLKDKEWKFATIKITRFVEQYTDGTTTENRTAGYLVDIKKGDCIIGFRDNGNINELWGDIKKTTGLFPID